MSAVGLTLFVSAVASGIAIGLACLARRRAKVLRAIQVARTDEIRSLGVTRTPTQHFARAVAARVELELLRVGIRVPSDIIRMIEPRR